MVKSQYTTIAPVTPKGKWVVCSRRIGTRERLTPIAECRSESMADNIVDALNALQGVVDKIDAPSARELATLKMQVSRDEARREEDRQRRNKEHSETQDKIRKLDQQLITVRCELRVALRERDQAYSELTELRTKAREEA